MARKIVAGNWKMNLLPQEGLELIYQVNDYCSDNQLKGVEVILAPPMLYLSQASEKVGNSKLRLAAQNCSDHENGAYTGEVSPQMIKGAGVNYVIIGHSERRQYYGDTDDLINKKLKQAYSAGVQPILCVGESLDDRKAEKQEDVVRKQLDKNLEGVNTDDLTRLVIAYEPVWAIGTGETASPEQAQEMHAFIRKYLQEKYDEKLASEISILYGGSVKPENAEEIFGQKDVDGGLIGGASLKKDSFIKLIEIGTQILA